MMLLDGKKVSQDIKDKLKEEVINIKEKYNKTPHLAIVLVGENQASKVYVRNKLKACDYIGIKSTLIKESENITEEQLLNIVNDLNNNDDMVYIYNFNKKVNKEIKGKNPIENPYVFAKLFRGNPYIKEVTLHKETIYIEDKAFKNCKSLERINIPPKVEYLTSQMFYGCTSLREIIAESPVPPKYFPENMECGTTRFGDICFDGNIKELNW